MDVRDIFAFEKSHIKGAVHIPLELLTEQFNIIPKGRSIIIYDETGKKGHQALRTLLGAGFTEVTNISGGHTSIQRQARTVGFKYLKIDLLPVELKSVDGENARNEDKSSIKANDNNSLLVVDVRTQEEFEEGAYPGSVNIPLDDLADRLAELGSNPGREIVVYCASGARSAYAQRMLMQMGYTNVKNGGGLANMMAYRNTKPASAGANAEPIIVDVRTPGEFRGGAFPSAINIPLDDLQMRAGELGSKSREITLYCASGARSAYGVRVLQQLGFANVKNGGGIMQMMRNR